VEPTVRYGPLDTSAPAEGLVLMLHGAGDSGEGMLDIAQDWAQTMPRVVFLMPSAPTRGQMSSWFGRRPVTKDNPVHLCIRYETIERQLLELLEVERAKLGLQISQIALWGYSAGSMMAGWLSLLLPEACAALVLLHGLAPDKRLPIPPPQPKPPRRAGKCPDAGPWRPPALCLGGERDVQIPAAAVKQASETLRKRHEFKDVIYIETPGQDHGIGDSEYEAMREFLASKLCGHMEDMPTQES